MKLGNSQISNCRLCEGSSFLDILDLGEQYFTGRFIKPSREDPAKARLAICMCESCSLIQLKDSYPASEMYGINYGYRSSITETMREHLKSISQDAIAYSQSGRGAKVLDIGSNDGTLLNYFADMCDNVTGIDPCADKHRHNYNKKAKIITNFFSAENIRAQDINDEFDIITSIAMFYDIDTPIEFAKNIRSMLSPKGIWITEQTHSHTLLESNCYDSICHEHVSYLSLSAMELICKDAGLKVLRVATNNINGGSFKLTIARDDSEYMPDAKSINAFRMKEKKLQLREAKTWSEFNAEVYKHKNEFETYLKEEASKGMKIFGYGASTKGNVLLQFCNISTDIMPFIMERDPQKYGFVTPGTRIPIISEEKGRMLNPNILVVFPWHFKEEIIKRENEFIMNGGVLVFPLPELTVITKGNLA